MTSTNTRWRDMYGRAWRVSLAVAVVLHAALLLFMPRAIADRLHEALLPSPMMVFRPGGPGSEMQAVALRAPATEEPVQETPPEPEEEEEAVEVTPEAVSEEMTIAEVESSPSESEGVAEGVPEGAGASSAAAGGGGSISPPRPLHLVVPRIPEGMDRKKVRGQSVHLLVEVLPDGRVGEVRIEQGARFAALDSVAARSARNSRYVPATRDGTGVTQWTRYELVFP
ncbi:MAG TPA: energy transducer TonB [Gemmatimonadota bacterium]|nr:energy transducer TonB [Gemmatimonadota bacterium]